MKPLGGQEISWSFCVHGASLPACKAVRSSVEQHSCQVPPATRSSTDLGREPFGSETYRRGVWLRLTPSPQPSRGLSYGLVSSKVGSDKVRKPNLLRMLQKKPSPARFTAEMIGLAG